jgi:hypothetical protein
MSHEYENVRRVVYGEGMTFIPVCEKCKRFVRPYTRVKRTTDAQPRGNNAHCKSCGRTTMIFEGYY